MKKRLCSLLLALVMVCAVSHTAIADYIHEYFRYTVEDQSVTITGYYGKESEVTVPAFIGGDPVNTIASGAFAGNEYVTVVYLPDTIMSIEDGAFGPGQSVVYAEGYSPDNPQSGDGNTDNSGIPQPNQPLGIRDDYGNLITTDDEGNLILVDSEGNETVLDDTQDYYRDTDDGGNLVIRSEMGETVNVQDGGLVSFTDGDDNKVTVSTETGGRQVSNADSSYGMEEAEAEFPEESQESEISETDTDAAEAKSMSSDTREESYSEEDGTVKPASENDAADNKSPAIIVTVIVIAAVIIILLIVLRTKKKKN